MDIISNNIRYGVGMVLMNSKRQIFAGKRIGNNPLILFWLLKKQWQMPQGGIQEGERPYDAALRELKEEIGTNNVKLITETKNWIDYTLPVRLRRKEANPVIGQRQKWFLFFFLGEDKDIDIHTTTHSEFEDWRWMTVHNIMRLIVPFKYRVYHTVFNEFKPYILNFDLNSI